MMLRAFRSVLGGPCAPRPSPDDLPGCSKEDTSDEDELEGMLEVEGTRAPVFPGFVNAPVLFRVLTTGSAGRAMVGGPGEGLGSAVDMARPSSSKPTGVNAFLHPSQ